MDDSESIRSLVCKTLRSIPAVGEIYEACDGVEGLSLLSRQAVDVVITDVNMPRMDGFKLVSAIRQNPQWKELMIIVLSSLSESVDKIKGLTMGANDYVTKPFEEGELQARVSVMFKVKELQEELVLKNVAMEEANVRLAMLANQDGLTGLANRRFFFERLAIENNRARRLEQPLSLLMADIDHFKTFNDKYGHLAGDEALKTVAGIARSSIRHYDLVGRYGGEEFIFFLPQTDSSNALVVAERIREKVHATGIQLQVPEGESTLVYLTVSIGLACWPDNNGDDANALVLSADKALYEAKAAGRNRTVVATPPAEGAGGKE